MKIVLPLLVGLLGIGVGTGVAAGAGDKKPVGKPAGKPGGGFGKPALGGKHVVKSGGESRAWSLLRPLLPAGVAVVGQVNVAAIRTGETFKQVRRLMEKDRDFKEVHDLMKSGCQIDLAEAVQDVAFAVGDSNDGHALVAISFKGVGEAELLRCAQLLINKNREKNGKGKLLEIQAKRAGSGPIVEYTVPGETDHIYAAWLATDVVAFMVDPDDRAQLEKMIGGKGGLQAAAPTRRAIGAVSAGAAAWGVYLQGEHLDAYELALAAASLTLQGGQLQFDVSLFMADADNAKRAAADWIAQRDRLAGGGGGAPAPIAAMAKTVSIVATADVVHVTASVAEKDFLGFFSLF